MVYNLCCEPGPERGSQEAGSARWSKRVSVLIGSKVVPLFPGKPMTSSERSPWSGLILEKHHHGPVAIPEHEHATFCLQLQTSGPVAMDWQSFGKSGRVQSKPGNLIWLTPGTRDSVLWHGATRRIVASVSPLLLKRAADEMELKGLCDFENRWSFQDEQLRLLLTEMDREINAGCPMGPLYGDLLGMSLSIALIKKYAHTSTLPIPLKGGLSRARLRQVMAYIDEHLDGEIRLEDLAAVAGLSLYHFARSFRDSAGVTAHQYVTQKRVERAKQLLSRPEWTIQQVASAAGFADGSQFARTFRSATGVSPSRWRKIA